jgi:hypothetical protein
MSIAIKFLVASMATSLWALAPEIAAKPASDPAQPVTEEELDRARAVLERAARQQLLQADDAAPHEAALLELIARQENEAQTLALLAERRQVDEQDRVAAAKRAFAGALAQRGMVQESQVVELEQEMERQRVRYHQLRDQMLHCREKIAELEAHRPDEGRSEVEQIREHERRMREVQFELQRSEIEAERSEMTLRRLEEDRERRMERTNIDSMMHRIDYVANWKEVAFESDLAVSMAVQGIVEMQFGAGGSGEAIEILSDLLEQVEDIGARTALRFAIKDVATTQGELHQATEQLRMIVLENAGGGSSRRR